MAKTLEIAQLADLPRPIAEEVAYELQYRKGDTIEVMEDQYAGALRFRNKETNRNLMLDQRYIIDMARKHGLGNAVFPRVPKLGQYYPNNAPWDYYEPTPGPSQIDAWKAIEAYASVMKYDMAGPSLSEAIKQMAGETKPPPPPDERPKGPVLVLAGTKEQALEFAEGIMGWKAHEWQYVSGYITVNGKKNASLYIVGTARERPDFGAIEGLFLMNNIQVLDTNE